MKQVYKGNNLPPLRTQQSLTAQVCTDDQKLWICQLTFPLTRNTIFSSKYWNTYNRQTVSAVVILLYRLLQLSTTICTMQLSKLKLSVQQNYNYLYSAHNITANMCTVKPHLYVQFQNNRLLLGMNSVQVYLCKQHKVNAFSHNKNFMSSKIVKIVSQLMHVQVSSIHLNVNQSMLFHH